MFLFFSKVEGLQEGHHRFPVIRVKQQRSDRTMQFLMVDIPAV